MNAPIFQKFSFWLGIQITAVLVAIPQAVRAEESADLSRFNVQSCVSDEMREATAQKYLKPIEVPQSPREFLSNLKYALEHDWLLQEDFYTVNNIRHLLGVSEVHVNCLENKQFLPSFSAYGAIYRARTAEGAKKHQSSNFSRSFYDQEGDVGAGGLSIKEKQLRGAMFLSLMRSIDKDSVELLLGKPLSRQEVSSHDFGVLISLRDQPSPSIYDLSDEDAWRYFVVYFGHHEIVVLQIQR